MLCILALDHFNELFKARCNLLNAAFRVDWVKTDHWEIASLPHIKRQKLQTAVTAENKGVLDRVRATSPVSKSVLC